VVHRDLVGNGPEPLETLSVIEFDYWTSRKVSEIDGLRLPEKEHTIHTLPNTEQYIVKPGTHTVRFFPKAKVVPDVRVFETSAGRKYKVQVEPLSFADIKGEEKSLYFFVNHSIVRDVADGKEVHGSEKLSVIEPRFDADNSLLLYDGEPLPNDQTGKFFVERHGLFRDQRVHFASFVGRSGKTTMQCGGGCHFQLRLLPGKYRAEVYFASGGAGSGTTLSNDILEVDFVVEPGHSYMIDPQLQSSALGTANRWKPTVVDVTGK